MNRYSYVLLFLFLQNFKLFYTYNWASNIVFLFLRLLSRLICIKCSQLSSLGWDAWICNKQVKIGSKTGTWRDFREAMKFWKTVHSEGIKEGKSVRWGWKRDHSPRLMTVEDLLNPATMVPAVEAESCSDGDFSWDLERARDCWTLMVDKTSLKTNCRGGSKY